MEEGTIEVHVSSLSMRRFRTSLELSDFSNEGRSINLTTPDAMYGSAKGIFSGSSMVSVFCLLCIAGSNVDDADNSDVAVVTAVAVLVVVVAGVEEGKEDGSRPAQTTIDPSPPSGGKEKKPRKAVCMASVASTLVLVLEDGT